MNYSETLEFLYQRLPMYQRVGKSAFKKDLSNTLALLDGLGNPHKSLKTVHIAGSNGKGTSAHAIAAVLQKAGYKTGLYTSPHLKHFTERIKINGEEIGQEAVTAFVESNKALIEEVNPSFFECTVAMAFDFFWRAKVDIGVIETGLGGRLDSTNVITPEVSLITTISLEHIDLLGDTLEKIAFEKAGIIKPKIPVVVGNIEGGPLAVIQEIADLKESRLVKSRAKNHSYDLSLAPPYFENNLSAILATIKELVTKGWTIKEQDLKHGLENFQSMTALKGRFQQIQDSPRVITDISHNADGLSILFEAIGRLDYNRLHLIFGTVNDKPLESMLSLFPGGSKLYFTQSSVPRSLSVSELERQALAFGMKGEPFEDVNAAKKAALVQATSNDLILITGSTFLVAELDEL